MSGDERRCGGDLHACRFVFMAALLLGAACTTLPASQSQGDSQPSGRSAAGAVPKRLTIGILQDPTSFAPWQALTTAGGALEVGYMVRRTLTAITPDGSVQPQIAISVPTLDNGDWRLNPNGTMEQTWRLKPNAKWHDGQPLTADDFVFSYEMATNPTLPKPIALGLNLISDVQALDPQTLLISFSGATPLAGQALLFPYPRHLLGDALASGDVGGFMNSEYWTTGFIHAGPYKLAGWQPGVSQTFAAFPDFYDGPPKIDTIVVRFLTDPNTLLANVLSGDVDVALPDGLSIESAAELQSGWAAPGTGNNVLLYADGRHYYEEFQHRPDYAEPAAALDPRVRHAFYLTIDKASINQVENAGLGVLADSWLPPEDPRRPEFAAAIPSWSLDLTMASRLLDDAGWRKGADGILVNQQTGERMQTELRANNEQGHVKANAIMADGWRQVGAEVTETTIPAALANDQQYRATFPFAGLSGYPIQLGWETYRYSCSTAATADTHWQGHRDGYCNPTVQPLIDKLDVTIPDAERTPLQIQIMQLILAQDFAGLPLYWQVSPLVSAKGITGLVPLNLGTFGTAYPTGDVELWDRTS